MKIVKTGLQILGILVLVPAVAMATLRFEKSNDDGPSIVFPGGALVAGELYTGPEPDWSFTADVDTIELELDEEDTSRLIWIADAEGRAFIASGYMDNFLGRLWKHWAVRVDNGTDLAVLRIGDTRYERRLVRIQQGDILDGVAASIIRKYTGGNVTPQSVAGFRSAIESGSTWIFELAPRS